MSANEYSVAQFFDDDSYEYVRRHVSVEEAVRAARHYTISVGAQIGSTRRVIVTDGDDYIVFEWRFGEGVIFPRDEAAGDAHYLPHGAS